MDVTVAPGQHGVKNGSRQVNLEEVARPLCLMTLCASTLLGSAALHPAWAQKTDTLVMLNGDVVTVEIKKLERGRLEASTDGMGTLSVEWDDLANLSSPSRFEVSTRDGERYVGSLGAPPRVRQLVVTGLQSTTLDFDDVIAIAAANPSFWSQWEGSLDLGYNFATAGESTQWSLASTIRRRAERLETRLEGDSFFSSQEGAEDTARHSIGVDVLRFVGDRWGLLALGQFERNDELQLALRSQVGGAFQYRFMQTNRAVLGSAAGLAVNREEFLDDTPGQNNLEAVFATRVEAFTFDTPKTDVTVSFLVFPNLTDWGRTRLELDLSLRQELAADFYFSVTLQDSFDSDPPSQGAERNDFSVLTSFGWSF